MSSQPNEDIASAVAEPALAPAREPAAGVAAATPAASSTSPAKKRGRPPGSRNRSTLERLAREEAARSLAPVEVERDAAVTVPLALVGSVCGWGVGEFAVAGAEPCSRRSFPGHALCLGHVRSKAERDLAGLLEDSEQRVIEAQLALREAALSAVETLKELTEEGHPSHIRMRSAVALITAAGASMDRSAPSTVVIAGPGSLVATESSGEAARIIQERLERLAVVSPSLGGSGGTVVQGELLP